MISQRLYNFLSEYICWVDSGAVMEDTSFSREFGLCSNALYFYEEHTSFDYPKGNDLRNELQEVLAADFNGDALTPFNDRHIEAYHIESRKHMCHENRDRLMWVRQKIKQYEDKQK